MVTNDERAQRYAEALSGLNIVGPMRRIFEDDEMADALEVLLWQEIEAVVPAVMAVADAEQAELRAELAEESAFVREAMEHLAVERAKVARVEALHVDDGSGYCAACPSMTLWPEECRTRAALAGPAEPDDEPTHYTTWGWHPASMCSAWPECPEREHE